MHEKKNMEESQSSSDEYVPSTDEEDKDSESEDDDEYAFKDGTDKSLIRTDSSASEAIKKSGVYIMSSSEKDGRRVYDKKNACYFCEKEFGKLGRHLFQVHKNEKEVAEIVALEKNDRTRQLVLDKLCRLGNFNHNLKVLEVHEGELKVMRRPGENEDKDPSNYLPCQFCHGFFQKKDLYRHCPKCPFAQEINHTMKSKKLQHAGRLLLAANKFPSGASQQLSDNVLAIMAMDDVSAVVRTDETILRVGSTLIEKRGNEKAVEVSQQMRILARLLIKVRELCCVPTLSLEKSLTPAQFDNHLASARYLGGYTGAPNTSADRFKSPSTAAKCGYALKKAAYVVKGQALRRKDMEAKNDVDLFLELLRTFLNEQILELSEDVKKNPMQENWRKLANSALARLIMFNKRRGGEASRMKLDAFQGRPLWGNIHNEEIVSALSATERELCKRFDMVEILGKRNRKVPVLLTPDVKAAILVLNRTREDGNVNEENPYVFAVNDGSSKQFLRGNDVIRHACKMVDLKNPDVITSTNLRKYVATVSQLVDMDQNELGWLATHLGHDVHIHKEFYRMQESTLEMAVVGNLLMAIDEGRAHEFKGKNLRDITLQDFHNTQSEEDAEV
ncbi:uncharacterized protein LOC114533333 [Dendronephthya gigantea]|uniref:uncharacterized protein LOC114533333 n=1 Tax=Dendronephthya gigantea TaxID=151771 RepID=UPI001069A882|nr:uncharacterized protein LOC114533333 [Dendronephthya gigantea]